MSETTSMDFSKHSFTGMPKGRMPKIVPKRYGLGEVLVKPEGARHCAGDLAYFKHMGEARAVVVALGGKKYLCFVF
jgi:hypothetical protein